MTQTPETGCRRLERFRPYLETLARAHLDSRWYAKVEPADLVQQTLLDAYARDDQFRGTTDDQRAAWLKQILRNNLLDIIRHFSRQKADVARERPLAVSVDDSFSRVDQWLVSVQASPSQQAIRTEQLLMLAEAVGDLPPMQREAIIRHHLQGLTLAETAAQLDRTTAAVAGLLHRGLRQLRKAFDA